MSSDTGSFLESKFQSWLHQIDCFSFKFTDFKCLINLIRAYPQIANRIPKAPCDRLVIYQGKSFFFELKHIKGTSLPLSNIKDHQIAYLLSHKNKGKGSSWLVIGYKYAKTIDIYALEIGVLMAFISGSERKSIPLDYCLTNGVRFKSIEDLENLLTIYK